MRPSRCFIHGIRFQDLKSAISYKDVPRSPANCSAVPGIAAHLVKARFDFAACRFGGKELFGELILSFDPCSEIWRVDCMYSLGSRVLPGLGRETSEA